MKKRTKILSVIMAGTIAGTIALSGCSLVSADPQADMNQVIAEVDVTASEELDTIAQSVLGNDVSLSDYDDAITSTEIYKRDLVALFLGSASSLLSDGTTTYGEAFETLAETLVQNEILIQYTTMATLADMVEDKIYSSADAAVAAFNAFETDAARYEWILAYQAEKYEYYEGEEISYVSLVQYTLYSSINSTIDGYEEDYLDIDDDDDTSSATLPTNVDTEVDNYYPVKDGKLDYGIYTGYGDYLISDSGAYSEDALEGSTRYTRMKAYNDFIQLLDSNYLITDDDDIRDVLSLNYVQNQYVNLLCEQMINNYFELYEYALEEDLASGDYKWVQERYEELLMQQEASYTEDYTALESAMSSMSSESFILYAPSTDNGNKFGYVYNILLPFSQSQSDTLTALSTLLDNGTIDEDDYYYYRNQLLKNVTTTDQRSSWFNGGVDYSFTASEYFNENEYYGSSDILFFENNLTNSDRYEALENYYGRYTYNGIAIQNDDDSYTLIANELDIDDMMAEISSYLEFVGGLEGKDYTFTWYNGTSDFEWDQKNGNTGFYSSDIEFTYTDSSSKYYGDVNYENFIYAYGKIDFTDFVATDLMNPESDSYTIMSVVNELQYAYTTDTSVLSEYVGYSVSAYSTSYVEEFEYACQKAISDYGAGTFMVLATDYGWHIIYVTYVLETGAQYTPVWSRISTEGTFENLFYEMLRSSALESASTEYQSSLLLALYIEDETVTIYEDAYSDLASLSTTLS